MSAPRLHLLLPHPIFSSSVSRNPRTWNEIISSKATLLTLLNVLSSRASSTFANSALRDPHGVRHKNFTVVTSNFARSNFIFRIYLRVLMNFGNEMS